MHAAVENVYLLGFFNGERGRLAARRQVVDSGSRDREIQRYVLKGLVSSGHRLSSPSHTGVQSTPAKSRAR